MCFELRGSKSGKIEMICVFFCLVEKRNRKMENVIYINVLLYMLLCMIIIKSFTTKVLTFKFLNFQVPSEQI